LTTAESHGWWKNDPGNKKITLTLYIQPNARHTAVAGRHGDALKLRIAAPAIDNKANWALIDFLHQWFNLPPSQISIRQGTRGRCKIVELARCDTTLMNLLASLEASCPAN